MRKKQSAAPSTARKETRRGTEHQINAIEQERLRAAVSELLIRSRADVRQELSSIVDRNRRRIERIQSGMNKVPEAERVAVLATMHADLEGLLAAYWFFITAQSFPVETAGSSVRDPVCVAESIAPFSELLFE
jgi:hypothetical protein